MYSCLETIFFFGQSLSEQLKKVFKKKNCIVSIKSNKPNNFGVIKQNKNGKIVKIVEKPKKFISNNIATGLYVYENSCLKICKNLKPSNRGELEITDLNNILIKKKKLENVELGRGSIWLDAGSASKASADLLLKSCFRTYGLKGCITISSNNYGPNQDYEKLIPKIIQRCINNKKIPIYNKGKEKRNWLFVEDNAEAIVKVAMRGKNRKSYLIGSNECYENIYVAKLICRIFDKIKPKYKLYEDDIIFVKDRPGHDIKYDIDNKKIKKELRWKCKDKFRNNIILTINSYLNQK